MWCSLFEIFRFVAWVCWALSRKMFPAARHDELPFGPEEEERMNLIGREMPFRCCVLYIKGDWSEFASSLGLPQWGDGLRPCFCCNSSPDDLYQVAGVGAMKLPWRENEIDDYFRACEDCEIEVVLNHADHGLVIM